MSKNKLDAAAGDPAKKGKGGMKFTPIEVF